MDTTGTLFDTPDSGRSETFDPLERRIYRRVLDGKGHVVHSEWLRAFNENRPVGECRNCGNLLTPHRPWDVTSWRTDYEAQCRDRDDGKPWCGWIVALPGGRYLPGSARKTQQHDFKD
jgi:hypothetical protein